MKDTRNKTNANAEILRKRIQDYQSHATQVELDQDHTVTLEDLENPNTSLSSNPPKIAPEHLQQTTLPRPTMVALEEPHDLNDEPSNHSDEGEQFINEDPEADFEVSDDSDEELHQTKESQSSSITQHQ